MILTTLSAAWLTGIAAANYFNLPLILVGLVVILLLAGLVLWRDDPR